nr:HNH endonuclease signature motif containing protein [Corynebacterium lactis]
MNLDSDGEPGGRFGGGSGDFASVNRFSHEADVHPLAEVSRQINRMHMVIARQVEPPPDGDVEAHLAYWSAVLGISRAEVSKYMDIGFMMSRFPRLAEVCEERGILPLAHLAMLGRHTRPIADAALARVEEDLLGVVTPVGDGEVLRGVRSLAMRVQRIIDEHAPEARPRDVEVEGSGADMRLAGEVADVIEQADRAGVSDAEAQEVREAAFDYFGDRATVRESFSVDDRDAVGATVITAVLERDHAVEVVAIVDAVARELKVGRTQAFLAALRGGCDVQVNLDLRRVLAPDGSGEPADTPVWLAGAGWLSPLAKESWMRRVSTLRVLGDSEVEGYAPSPPQRAFVQARDGVCSFPGCDVPAEKCDIDHIVEFETEGGEGAGENPGKTSTDNLHCLCRKHHNLKTAGIARVVRRDDGVEEWTFLSKDEGPFAETDKAHTGHGRYTFESQTVKKSQALAEYNRKLRELKEELARLVEKARLAAGKATQEGGGSSEDADDPPF